MSDVASLSSAFVKSVEAVTKAKASVDQAEAAAQSARTALADAVDVAKKSKQAFHDHVDSVAPDVNR